MSRLFAQRLLLVCMTAPAPTSVLAQVRPVPGIEDASGAALPPLWQGSQLPLRHGRGQAGTTLAPFVTSALPEDAAWEGFLTPANHGTTSTFVEFHGKLVLTSSVAGSVATQGLVTWDGTTFEALPAVTGYGVSALGVWNDHLIAATYDLLNPARFAILQLDGAVWDTLGKANSFVEKFGEFQNHLIAGGGFSSVNGVPCSLVAAFDGASWSNAGTGIPGGEVTGLTIHQGELVAGGPGVVSLAALGGTWQPVGTGIAGTIQDVLSDGVELYTSGRIYNSNLTTALGSFMQWNGTTWSGTGSPTNWGVTDVYMTRWNGKVVVNVRAPGGVGTLAQWDGVALTDIPGDSLNSIAFGIGTWGTKLVATSPLQNGSVLIPSIATFDGSQWGTVQQAWGPEMHGIYGGLWDMRPWGGKLIVAGILTMLAEQDHWTRGLGIAAWDGAHWSPLGTGIAAQYAALGEYGGDLIAFGYSFSVRGTSIQNVARWDGNTWSAIGSNAPTDAVSSASFLGDLYLGTEEGSSILAHWNGSTWTTVPGLDGNDEIEALVPSGGRLVVAGFFPTVGGLASPNVAFWDGATWAAAGAGVNNIAYAAAEWLGQPVIGGAFTASGATPLPGVAIWDGAQWQPMGTTAVEVDQLRVQDGELYATGDFRLPDDSVVETIAHWTGTDWHVLGSSSTGYPFATYGGYLYQAGSGLEHGHPAHGLLRVPLYDVLDVPKPGPHPSTLALTASPNPSRGRTAFAFTLPSAGHAKLTVVDVAGRVVATLADGSFDAGEHQARWSTAAPAGVYFARLEAFGGASSVVRLVRFE